MHAPLNGVGTTPVINILAIPSHRIHSNINPHQCVAFVESFVNYFMKSLPFPAIIHHHHPLIHLYVNTPHDAFFAKLMLPNINGARRSLSNTPQTN